MKRVLMVLGVVLALAVGATVAQQLPQLSDPVPTHRTVLDKNNVPQEIPLTPTEREERAVVMALSKLPPETRAALWNRKLQAAIDSGTYSPREVEQIQRIIALNNAGFFKTLPDEKVKHAEYKKSHWDPAAAVLGQEKMRKLFYTPPPIAWVREYIIIKYDEPLDGGHGVPATGGPAAGNGRWSPPQAGGPPCACAVDSDCTREYYCCNVPRCATCVASAMVTCGPQRGQRCNSPCKLRG